MYLKRKISAIALIAVMVFAVSGCKEKAPQTPNEDSYQTDRYIPTVEDIEASVLEDKKAPVTEKATYNLLLHPVVVTVEKGSYLKESALTVVNFSGFELPKTGGIGTTIYTAMGTLMICAAGAYIILSKKRVVC